MISLAVFSVVVILTGILLGFQTAPKGSNASTRQSKKSTVTK